MITYFLNEKISLKPKSKMTSINKRTHTKRPTNMDTLIFISKQILDKENSGNIMKKKRKETIEKISQRNRLINEHSMNNTEQSESKKVITSSSINIKNNRVDSVNSKVFIYNDGHRTPTNSNKEYLTISSSSNVSFENVIHDPSDNIISHKNEQIEKLDLHPARMKFFERIINSIKHKLNYDTIPKYPSISHLIYMGYSMEDIMKSFTIPFVDKCSHINQILSASYKYNNLLIFRKHHKLLSEDLREFYNVSVTYNCAEMMGVLFIIYIYLSFGNMDEILNITPNKISFRTDLNGTIICYKNKPMIINIPIIPLKRFLEAYMTAFKPDDVLFSSAIVENAPFYIAFMIGLINPHKYSYDSFKKNIA